MNKLKKLIAVLLSIAMVCSSITIFADETIAEDTVKPILGSIDGNTEISANDALLILKHSAKISILDEELSYYADVNHDGLINASDALDILKVAAKVIERFNYVSEQGIMILKEFIAINGTKTSAGNVAYEFDITSRIAEELIQEGINPEEYLEGLSYYVCIIDNRTTGDIEFEYTVIIDDEELGKSTTYTTLIFNESNTFGLARMRLSDPDLGTLDFVGDTEFLNTSVTGKTDFDLNVTGRGDALADLTEAEYAELIEALKPSLNILLHENLCCLDGFLEEEVELSVKDLGFTNYNVSDFYNNLAY